MTSTPRSRRARANPPRLVSAALALGLCVALPAAARQSDRDQPMNVEHADSFEGFQKPNSVSTLKGHVVISQGTLKLTGDLVKVHFDANEDISRTVITGAPAHVEQRDDNGNLVQGNAATIDYDNIKGIAILAGDAMVKQQGRGEAHGDKLTYDTRTSQMTGSSSGDGRVHMIFLPKPRRGAAPAAGPSAPASSAPAARHEQP